MNSFNNRRPNNNNKKGILNKINQKRPKFNNNNKASKNGIKINKNANQFYSAAQNASKKEATSNKSPSEKFIFPSNTSSPLSSKNPSPQSIKKQKFSDHESENKKLASFLSSAVDIDERFIDKTTASLDVDYRQANLNDNLIAENKR